MTYTVREGWDSAHFNPTVSSLLVGKIPLYKKKQYLYIIHIHYSHYIFTFSYFLFILFKYLYFFTPIYYLFYYLLFHIFKKIYINILRNIPLKGVFQLGLTIPLLTFSTYHSQNNLVTLMINFQ